MIITWLLSLAPPAVAQDEPPELSAEDQRGRELYDNGVLLYNEGRYEQAILAWQAGYELTKRAGFLYNISNAYERLGKYEEALDTLAEYRVFAEASEREVIARRITSLEKRRDEKAASAPVNVAPPPADPSPPQPPPVLPPTTGRRSRVSAGVTIAAAGALLVGGGVWSGQRSRSASQEVTALCVEQLNEAWLCPSNARPALTRARYLAVGADLAVGTGSALAITGIILAITSPRKRPRVGASVRPQDGYVDVRYTWTVR